MARSCYPKHPNPPKFNPNDNYSFFILQKIKKVSQQNEKVIAQDFLFNELVQGRVVEMKN